MESKFFGYFLARPLNQTTLARNIKSNGFILHHGENHSLHPSAKGVKMAVEVSTNIFDSCVAGEHPVEKSINRLFRFLPPQYLARADGKGEIGVDSLNFKDFGGGVFGVHCFGSGCGRVIQSLELREFSGNRCAFGILVDLVSIISRIANRKKFYSKGMNFNSLYETALSDSEIPSDRFFKQSQRLDSNQNRQLIPNFTSLIFTYLERGIRRLQEDGGAGR